MGSSREEELLTILPVVTIMTPTLCWRFFPVVSWAQVGVSCLGLVLAPTLRPTSLRAQTPDSTSVVRGQVLDHEEGVPLAGAAVSLASGPGPTRGIGTRVTDSDGEFLFRSVPPGYYRIIVRLIGYGDLQDTLRVDPSSDLDLQLPLSVSPIELEPLVVMSERRAPLGRLRDFERRRRTRSGTFFDREEIEAWRPMLFSDLLRMVPGARVIPAGPYEYTVRLRGGCSPVLWVDGMRLSTFEGADHILQTMDLEAVEVYHSTNLPVEFGAHPCGGIIAWTRMGEPTVRKGSFWRRLAVGAGFLMLALISTR